MRIEEIERSVTGKVFYELEIQDGLINPEKDEISRANSALPGLWSAR